MRHVGENHNESCTRNRDAMGPVSHVGPESSHVGAVARVLSAGVGTAREQTLDDVIRNICNELAAMFWTTVASVHVDDPLAVHEMLTTRLLIGHDPMVEAYFNCTLTTGMVITLGPEGSSANLRYVVYPNTTNIAWICCRSTFYPRGTVRDYGFCGTRLA